MADLLGTRPHWLSGPEDLDEWHGVLTVRHLRGHRLAMGVGAHRLTGDYGESLWLLSQEPGDTFPEDHALADWVSTASPVAVTVYDTDLRCVWQNAAMRRLTGVPDRYRIGRGPVAAISGPDAALWEERMRQVLETGCAAEGFLVHGRTRGHPDHDRVLTASASALRDRTGRVTGVCATVIDTTDYHRAQERLTLLNEASMRIGSTLDVIHTGQELAELVVPRLADFVSVDLVEALLSGDAPPPGAVTGAVLRRVAHQSVRDGVPEAVVNVGDVDFYTANSPQARCLASGRSEFHRTMDEVVGTWVAEDPVRRAKLSEYGFHSWIVVPVTARGTTLGVAVFVRSRRPEPFDAEDLSVAEELVARAAVCLDNARRFTREHTAAVALQRSLLPHQLPEHSAVQAAYRYLPGAPELGVGGDWFDIIPLSGARVALVVGDVIGHGLQASATMGRLRTAVRTLADIDLAPDELLTRLDDLVIRLASESETAPEATAADMGATCLYAVYDPVSGRCCLARAGHPLPAVVRPDGTADFLELPAGPPLGLGGLPFEALEMDLPEGSLLALYTNGLVESRKQGVEAGLDGLLRALVVEEVSPDALCDQVVGSLLPDRPADDAALLLARVQRLGAGQVATWDVPAAPDAVAGVRAQAVRRLEEWGLEEQTFVSELVVSELVTNAVRYGGTPIRLRLIRDRTLICEVSDGSNTAPHLRRARLFDEGGRGLMLVAQLTQHWGVRQTPVGKVIWCEQTLPPGV
ncbi:SpoIIE family protein phosphatase [Streptomyces sp. NEAU-Y11]|nr:SpoIIE family protein phosphatase [Streptomyces sp. NEAU-Y11]MCP9213505.1 SpoIIE family protein phosphatase [Streptomyces sp. NEAU-Y11]